MGTQEDERILLERGLLQENGEQYTGDGSVDIKGNPVLKSKTGNWSACPFILGTECCERLAYCGIAINLVNYLTSKLHQGNVTAARNVTTWSGTCFLTPIIGAVIADSYLGFGKILDYCCILHHILHWNVHLDSICFSSCIKTS